MPTLDAFRVLGKHFLGMLSGIYIAAIMARLIAWFWPSARIPAFAIIAVFFVLSDLSAMVVELRRGKLSTGIIIFDSLPTLLLGTGAILLIGEFVGRFWPNGRSLVDSIGIYFWVLMVLTATKYSVQDRNLKEDLESSPSAIRFTASSHSHDNPGPSHIGHVFAKESEETTPPQRPSMIQGIAKTVLVLGTIFLTFLLLYMITH